MKYFVIKNTLTNEYLKVGDDSYYSGWYVDLVEATIFDNELFELVKREYWTENCVKIEIKLLEGKNGNF